jgi:HK97 family phage portal protein
MKIFNWESRDTKFKNAVSAAIREEIEQRNITIGPSTAVGLPYGGFSINLSSEQAMKLSAVYRCVDVKSSDIGFMPWDVLIKRGELEWVKDDTDFSYSILNIQPNPSCSSFTFWKTFTSKVELNGNAYARIFRDEMGNPTQLELLCGGVTEYMRADLTVFYVHLHPYTNEEQYIDGDDMIHVLNFSYDGLLGVSTLTHAMNITGLAAAADGQAKGFFANGANVSGVLTVPGKIDPPKAAAIKTAWGQAFALSSTTGQAGGVAVLEGGMEFTPVTVNPKDAQMIETRAFNVIDICRFFGVHPSKVFDMSASAYASAESYQLGYITDTMTPLARKIDNEVNRKFFRPSQRKKKKVMLRVRDMRSADLKTLAEYYTKMSMLGTYSPNDICREMNLPLDPEGYKRYVQVNLTELGKTPEPIQNKNKNVIADGKGN